MTKFFIELVDDGEDKLLTLTREILDTVASNYLAARQRWFISAEKFNEKAVNEARYK